MPQQMPQQENSAEGINACCNLPVVADQRPLFCHAAQGAVSADTSHRHQHLPAGDVAAHAPPPPSADAARFPSAPFASSQPLWSRTLLLPIPPSPLPPAAPPPAGAPPDATPDTV
ncbi:hypothetical protein CLOM_g18726 [Closterium sp. NIES-68]|nr:hypothetical protein CLOM_g18726 [Closterium sp. NIES-68]